MEKLKKNAIGEGYKEGIEQGKKQKSLESFKQSMKLGLAIKDAILISGIGENDIPSEYL